MHAFGSKTAFLADGLFIGSGYTADHQAESLVVSDFPDDVLESEEVFSAF